MLLLKGKGSPGRSFLCGAKDLLRNVERWCYIEKGRHSIFRRGSMKKKIVVVVILAVLLPSVKAANLNPIEALR